jgi:hypothetical protein
MMGLGGFAKDVIAGTALHVIASAARRSMLISPLGMKNRNEIFFGE